MSEQTDNVSVLNVLAETHRAFPHADLSSFQRNLENRLKGDPPRPLKKIPPEILPKVIRFIPYLDKLLRDPTLHSSQELIIKAAENLPSEERKQFFKKNLL